jgi:hypothetical protein
VAGCCARAANGAMPVIPNPAMNSLRLIRSP